MFSVESAYTVKYGIPRSRTQSITSLSFSLPWWWPKSRSKLLLQANLRLPSMIIETCSGSSPCINRSRSLFARILSVLEMKLHA